MFDIDGARLWLLLPARGLSCLTVRTHGSGVHPNESRRASLQICSVIVHTALHLSRLTGHVPSCISSYPREHPRSQNQDGRRRRPPQAVGLSQAFANVAANALPNYAK